MGMTQTEVATVVAWTYLAGACLASTGLGVVFLFALVVGHKWQSSPKALWTYALWSIALWPLMLGTIIHAVTMKRAGDG